VDTPAPTSVTTEVSRLVVTRLASRINSSDPYEILGVKSDATADDVRAAYLKLLRSCDPATSPDRDFRSILGQMSHQLTEAFKEIERRRGEPRPAARRTAADRRSRIPAPAPATGPAPAAPAKPRPLPESRPAAAPTPLDPTQANEAAAKAHEAGLLAEALAILHEALPHLEGQPRRMARVRKARVLLAVENGAKLAEEELKAAIAEDGGNVEAYVALGAIYRERGSLALAMMAYRKAFDLQPKNVAAKEALDELRAPPQTHKAPEASVLRRIFGR